MFLCDVRVSKFFMCSISDEWHPTCEERSSTGSQAKSWRMSDKRATNERQTGEKRVSNELQMCDTGDTCNTCDKTCDTCDMVNKGGRRHGKQGRETRYWSTTNNHLSNKKPPSIWSMHVFLATLQCHCPCVQRTCPS